MKKPTVFFTIFLCPLFLLFSVSFCPGEKLELQSSFNPVGSGARALGMGGAFIAVADDATAASWNPGGLIQLKKPEISFVYSVLEQEEENDFLFQPESAETHQVTAADLNYFSAAYPFEFLQRNMILSLSYQRLYDFYRDWSYVFVNSDPDFSHTDHWNFEQKGGLSAMGLSYGVQIVPDLSLGFTLNLWDEDLSKNSWRQTYRTERNGLPGNTPFRASLYRTKDFSFEGLNFNFGILWRIHPKLTVGGVFKSPFTADISYQEYKHYTENYPDRPEKNLEELYAESRNEELDMPMSYGLGFVYRFSDQCYFSGDIYRTHWEDFIYRNADGTERSAVSGLGKKDSDIEPTCQIRTGFEYLILNKARGYAVPLRCGIFYDPAPAEGSPDDYFGFSLGTGFSKNNSFSLDTAYQYRHGNDVGNALLQGSSFSQDITEHRFYISVIVYLTGN